MPLICLFRYLPGVLSVVQYFRFLLCSFAPSCLFVLHDDHFALLSTPPQYRVCLEYQIRRNMNLISGEKCLSTLENSLTSQSQDVLKLSVAIILRLSFLVSKVWYRFLMFSWSTAFQSSQPLVLGLVSVQCCSIPPSWLLFFRF